MQYLLVILSWKKKKKEKETFVWAYISNQRASMVEKEPRSLGGNHEALRDRFKDTLKMQILKAYE